MSDILFDEVGAGRYLGGDDKPISPRTMQRWRHDKTGASWVRVGSLIRYRKSALDAYLAENTVSLKSEESTAGGMEE